MKKLTDIKQNFAQWYQDVLDLSEIVDTSPTKGSFIIRPYGYALWENIQGILDQKIKALGVQNAYFPLLIPESFLKKEAKHVEGFSPELAVVTHAGGKKLEEPYVVRPTSETIIYDSFARWIKSHRDLPLKINQWANVVRWEMRTRAFLRTTEFLWQEGHTAHATRDEATQMATDALGMYKTIAHDLLAIPVITGEKSESERFAGADVTYTFEGLMQDGKALQMGTSHILAQSFSDAFGIQFQDHDGTVRSPYCTSWGVTTRLIGALIMTHGDQNGLIVPPNIAPIQAVIIPIYKNDEQKARVLEKAEAIKTLLTNMYTGICSCKNTSTGSGACSCMSSRANLRNSQIIIDADEQKTPGAKFFHWEVRGVPVRIEIGPKDIEKNQVVLVNRAEPDKAKKKLFVSEDTLCEQFTNLLQTIQKTLFERAQTRRDAQWHQADDIASFGKKLNKENGMYQTGWCQSSACEEKLKQYSGTIRCVLTSNSHKKCFACSQASSHDILIAKAY